MMTIQPSADNGNDPGEPPANTDQQQKPIPLVWIPATLVVGLLIAAIYLGGRIVKARPQPQPQVVHVAAPVQPAPAEVPKALPPPAEPEPTVAAPPAPPTASASREFTGPEPLTVVTPDDGIPLITPQSKEMYIQVGALNQEATRRFVQRLRNEKLEPHVAPGPTPELMRVLIGPFASRDALNEKKAQIETEGIETFIRQY